MQTQTPHLPIVLEPRSKRGMGACHKVGTTSNCSVLCFDTKTMTLPGGFACSLQCSRHVSIARDRKRYSKRAYPIASAWFIYLCGTSAQLHSLFSEKFWSSIHSSLITFSQCPTNSLQFRSILNQSSATPTLVCFVILATCLPNQPAYAVERSYSQAGTKKPGAPSGRPHSLYTKITRLGQSETCLMRGIGLWKWPQAQTGSPCSLPTIHHIHTALFNREGEFFFSNGSKGRPSI